MLFFKKDNFIVLNVIQKLSKELEGVSFILESVFKGKFNSDVRVELNCLGERDRRIIGSKFIDCDVGINGYGDKNVDGKLVVEGREVAEVDKIWKVTGRM